MRIEGLGGRSLCEGGKGWSAEGQSRQGVDQKRINKVNRQIEKVIAEDIEAAQAVIEGEGEIADETARRVAVAFAGEEAIQVVDDRVLDDGGQIVENEGDLEGGSVDAETDASDQNAIEEGVCSRFFHDHAVSRLALVARVSRHRRVFPDLGLNEDLYFRQYPFGRKRFSPGTGGLDFATVDFPDSRKDLG